MYTGEDLMSISMRVSSVIYDLMTINNSYDMYTDIYPESKKFMTELRDTVNDMVDKLNIFEMDLSCKIDKISELEKLTRLKIKLKHNCIELRQYKKQVKILSCIVKNMNEEDCAGLRKSLSIILYSLDEKITDCRHRIIVNKNNIHSLIISKRS